MQVSIRSY